MKLSTCLSTLACVTLLLGCEEEASKTPPAKPSAAAPAATPAPSAAPAPTARKLRDDCPKGSSGVGTSSDPCLASGESRMMEVKYTGKTTDEGPKFQIINKADSQILFGSLAVYFYDKAGKQMPAVAAAGEKAKPFQTCSGNIFAGAVKPGEKIFMFFSCVKKNEVPEGAVTLEAEVKTVGFADEEGKKNEFYWSNPDLVPNERPKGGTAAKAAPGTKPKK